jgi:hypothetical protein
MGFFLIDRNRFNVFLQLNKFDYYIFVLAYLWLNIYWIYLWLNIYWIYWNVFNIARRFWPFLIQINFFKIIFNRNILIIKRIYAWIAKWWVIRCCPRVLILYFIISNERFICILIFIFFKLYVRISLTLLIMIHILSICAWRKRIGWFLLIKWIRSCLRSKNII